jgi:DNA-binding transcriptional MerR regulator
VPRTDFRDIEMVAGRDPYAWKGSPTIPARSSDRSTPPPALRRRTEPWRPVLIRRPQTGELRIESFSRVGLSEACRRYGLTPRAIRFYEQMGLVQAGRDRQQLPLLRQRVAAALAWISRLRSGGVPLSDIRAVLEESGPTEITAKARAALVRQAARLQRELDRANDQIAAFDAWRLQQAAA